MHPEYSSRFKINDIALIQVKNLTFTDNVMPACLHTDSNDLDSMTKLIVTGWGTTASDSMCAKALAFLILILI